MGMCVLLGALAAFGVLSILWATLGCLLPGGRGGAVVILLTVEDRPEPILRRYRWLRDLGLLRCPLLIVDGGLEPRQRQRLEREWEICTLEALPARLEQERKKLD